MAKIKNLTQLKAAGGIVSREPVRKEVTWVHTSGDGEEMTDTFDVLIVKSSIGMELSIFNKEPDREHVLMVLSKRVMLEDDKAKPILLAYEQWSEFDPTLALAIYKAVQEVTNPPKASPPQTNSSVNSSPVASAETPSKQPVKT